MNKMFMWLVGLGLMCNVNAKDDVFIGVEFGVTQYKATITKSSYAPDLGEQSGHSTYQTIRLGKYFGEHRFSISGNNSRDIGFDYDYMFDLEGYDTTPYIGTGISYRKVDYINSNANSSGIFIPFNIGITYPIADRFTLDTGIRIALDTFEEDSAYFSYKSDRSISYRVGLNYSF